MSGTPPGSASQVNSAPGRRLPLLKRDMITRHRYYNYWIVVRIPNLTHGAIRDVLEKVATPRKIAFKAFTARHLRNVTWPESCHLKNKKRSITTDTTASAIKKARTIRSSIPPLHRPRRVLLRASILILSPACRLMPDDTRRSGARCHTLIPLEGHTNLVGCKLRSDFANKPWTTVSNELLLQL